MTARSYRSVFAPNLFADRTAVLDEHGGVDGLVNNAGGQYRAPLAETTTKGFEAVVRTNLTVGSPSYATSTTGGWPGTTARS